MANILLTGVAENTRPAPVPAGTYVARIDATSADEVKMNKNDKPYISITFVVEGHPELTGRKVVENYYLNPEAQWKLHRMLDTLGLLPEDDGQFDTKVLHGKMCRIKTVQVPNATGTDVYTNVSAVMPAEGAGATAGNASGNPFKKF